MNLTLKNLGFILMTVALVSTWGCAKKADVNKPIEKIQAEVQKMSIKDLESTANAYVKEITKKKTELNQVAEKIKSLSPKDLLGPKVKTVRDQVAKISSQISELTKRYQIYASKYQQLGGDISKIKVE